MKNTTYNTGRTVTINLDTLGNADLWQLFQIVTDGTNNIWQGEEEGASPKADPDAATEIFLHIAETADDRADGADAFQRDFLLGIKTDYIDTFDTDPADDLRKRLEIEEEDTDDAPEEIEEEAGDIFDRLVAAWRATANDNLDAILAANGQDAENEPNNVYRAGVFEGLAEAAAWMIYDTITPEDDADDINAIKAAVYRAYGVAI